MGSPRPPDATLNRTSMILRIPSVTHLRQRRYQKEYFRAPPGWNRGCASAKRGKKWPDNTVRIGVFYMRQAIETAPRDGSAIILVDDASGTYDVAHWSPEAGEWIGENGVPTKITPSDWYPMPRDKYLSLESDGSSNPSQVRPSPAWARRYATSSIAAALVAAALIGTYFRDDVAALVTRYAGQQDNIFGGSTIGEQVVVQGTQLQSHDSQKTNLLALQQQAEADQASAQEAARVKQAVAASVPDAQ